MGGGLLNLVSEGNKNIFLNGNPKKTFFSTKYKKYTNFGMEKLRLDVNGSRTLNMTTQSQFIFNVRDYGDLLMDTYFVLTLPNIWSPIVEILPPPNNFVNLTNTYFYGRDYLMSRFMRNIWPYEFKWIENLGSQLIKRVRYLVGGVVIQEFTGEYLLNSVHRDFSDEKKELFDEMTGNTKQLNDPANYGGRTNNYPNSIYNENWQFGSEPSIRGRKIYVPLNIWSTLNSKLAFPLVSLSKQNLRIEVTCRPIQELFVVRYIPTPLILKQFNEIIIRINNGSFTPSYMDISSEWNLQIQEEFMENCQLVGEYVQANQNENRYLFYRFVNPTVSPPPGADVDDINGIRVMNGTVSGTSIDANYYNSTQSIWNADAHLICNYVFLSQDEREVFKNKKQQYLVKFIDETDYLGLQGSSIIRLFNYGLATSWMWFLQRSDVQLRNEWSNYTNWLTSNLPFKTINNLIKGYTNLNVNSVIYNILGSQQNSKNGISNRNYVNLKNFLYRFLDSFEKVNSEIGYPEDFSFNLLNKFLIDNKYNDNKFLNNFPDFKSNPKMAEQLAATVGFGIIKPLNGDFSYLPHSYNISGPFHKKNEKDILKSASILLNGKIRENTMNNKIYNHVEPYLRSNGASRSGLLCYNFSLNTDPFDTQPSGALNLSKFSVVDMEIELIHPEKDLGASTKILVDSSGEMVGLNRSQWEIFTHTYRLHFMQERYILLEFENGNLIVNNLV